MLSNKLFSTIVEHTPLISIDLIIRNYQQQVLLGKRINRPAQSYWFVPGGRILKDESFEQAFNRLVKGELGFDSKMSEARFLGPFEHHYDNNFSGTGFTTHYVVLAFELRLDCDIEHLPNIQHDNYQWFSETDLLKSDTVHNHTKWYFQSEKYIK